LATYLAHQVIINPMHNPSRILVSCLFSASLCGAAFSQVHYPEPYGNEGTSGYDSPTSNPIAVTDGTPLASTNAVANETASTTALISSSEAEVVATEQEAAATPTPSSIDIDVGMGSYEIGNTDADLYTIRLPYSWKQGERTTFMLNVPLSITNFKDVTLANGTTGDAKVYGSGVNFGMTYKVYDKQDNVPYRWKISPVAGIFRREASDINMGSYVYNLGFGSSFAYQVAKGWVVNVGNSLTLAWNNGLKSYPDPIRDEQQVLINGVQVYRILDRWTVGGMVIDTRFLKDTLVDNYQTYAVTCGYKITRTRSVRFSLVYENGNNYSSFSGTFGSSWKF
jgi:hypothetical protein